MSMYAAQYVLAVVAMCIVKTLVLCGHSLSLRFRIISHSNIVLLAVIGSVIGGLYSDPHYYVGYCFTMIKGGRMAVTRTMSVVLHSKKL